MRTTTTITLARVLLGAIIPAAVLAAPPQGPAPQPALAVRNDTNAGVVKIAYGQQIQTDDEANHWVVWIEGENACPPAQVLGLLAAIPCGTSFNISGSDGLELSDCGEDSEPNALHANGQFVRLCKQSKQKTIHCHGDQHNIIKHGKCV